MDSDWTWNRELADARMAFAEMQALLHESLMLDPATQAEQLVVRNGQAQDAMMVAGKCLNRLIGSLQPDSGGMRNRLQKQRAAELKREFEGLLDGLIGKLASRGLRLEQLNEEIKAKLLQTQNRNQGLGAYRSGGRPHAQMLDSNI